MGLDCPYCGEWVTREHCMDVETEDGTQVSEVWVCPHCDRSFSAVYEFEDFFEPDGTPIPEGGEEEEDAE